MCIRDRGKTTLISTLQYLYIDDQRQMHFSRDSEETRRYYFCLLYTSDAADHLLCVDLGGRRIIIKKCYIFLPH